MEQKGCLIFGIIILGIILISGCVQQQGREYIPPEAKPSAINLDENQAKQRVESELINDLGQEYFDSHYLYLKTESLIQNQETVGYKIYYTYNYDIKNFESEEMYVYIGAAGPEHRIIYNKEGVLSSPIGIIYSYTPTAETDCLNAFSNETRKITNWNHEFNIDTNKDRIALISTGQIEDTNEVIFCEFDVTSGDILTNYRIKVTPVTLLEPIE